MHLRTIVSTLFINTGWCDLFTHGGLICNLIQPSFSSLICRPEHFWQERLFGIHVQPVHWESADINPSSLKYVRTKVHVSSEFVQIKQKGVYAVENPLSWSYRPSNKGTKLLLKVIKSNHHLGRKGGSNIYEKTRENSLAFHTHKSRELYQLSYCLFAFKVHPKTILVKSSCNPQRNIFLSLFS